MKKSILFICLSCLSLVAAPLKIGIDSSYPPFGYLKDGEIVGFDVDFAQMLFKELNLDYRFVPTEYSKICSKISSGELDLGISAMGVDENTVDCDHSISYYESKILYITTDDSGIKTKEDLAGKRIGVVNDGEVFHDIVAEIPDAKAVDKDKISSMILSLLEYKIDAIIVDSTGVLPFLKGNYEYLSEADQKSFEMAKNLGIESKLIVFHEELSPESQTVIAFPKDSRLKDLRIKVNRAISKFRNNNSFDMLFKKYGLNYTKFE